MAPRAKDCHRVLHRIANCAGTGFQTNVKKTEDSKVVWHRSGPLSRDAKKVAGSAGHNLLTTSVLWPPRTNSELDRCVGQDRGFRCLRSARCTSVMPKRVATAVVELLDTQAQWFTTQRRLFCCEKPIC